MKNNSNVNDRCISTVRAVAKGRGPPRTLSGSSYIGLLLNSNTKSFPGWGKIMGGPPVGGRASYAPGTVELG